MIKNKIKLLQLFCFLCAGGMTHDSSSSTTMPNAVPRSISAFEASLARDPFYPDDPMDLYFQNATIFVKDLRFNFTPDTVKTICKNVSYKMQRLSDMEKARCVMHANKIDFLNYMHKVGHELESEDPVGRAGVWSVISCFESIYVSLNAGLYKNPEEVLGNFEGLLGNMRTSVWDRPLCCISTFARDFDKVVCKLKMVNFEPDQVKQICREFESIIDNLSDVAKIQYAIATNKEKDFINYMIDVLEKIESDYPSTKEQLLEVRLAFELQHIALNKLLYEHIEKYIPHEVFEAFEDLIKDGPNAVANFLEVCTVEKMTAALEGIDYLGCMMNYIRCSGKPPKQKGMSFTKITHPDLITRFQDFKKILKQNPNLFAPMDSILNYYRT